jgi:hypothetical protein
LGDKNEDVVDDDDDDDDDDGVAWGDSENDNASSGSDAFLGVCCNDNDGARTTERNTPAAVDRFRGSEITHGSLLGSVLMPSSSLSLSLKKELFTALLLFLLSSLMVSLSLLSRTASSLFLSAFPQPLLTLTLTWTLTGGTSGDGSCP